MKRTQEERNDWTTRAAEAARLNLTPAQAKLWEPLSAMGFGLEYEAIARTKNGGEYPRRFDFFHDGAKVAVEIDGGYHKRTRGRDRRRDQRFATDGITTLRFENKRALKETEAVLAEIQRALNSIADS